MTTPESILIDLLAGQSTADSIAQRLHVPELVILAMLQRHETDGLVTSCEIADGTLTVWAITEPARAARKSSKPFPRMSIA